VRIRSDRRHTFDASPDELWEAMSRVGEYRRWWPWLRHFEAPGLEPGVTWAATVQPPLPYRLRFDLLLLDVREPRLVVADITGDIEGEARIEVEPTAVGSELHFTSELVPTNPILRSVARMAAPVAQFGHQWVLDTGLRQFRSSAFERGS
jgi:hypothetical protein